MFYGRFRQFVFWISFLIPIAYAGYKYPQAPKRMGTQFNPQGEPNNWGDPFNLFVVPLILGISGMFICALISNLRRIDSRRYRDFDDIGFRQIGMFTQVFLSSLSLLYVYISTHPHVEMQKLSFVLIGLFFSACGICMPRLKPNYFVGFRLSWTLVSDSNWSSTHLLAGKLWVIGGLLLLPASLLLDRAQFAIACVVVISALIVFPTIHGYLFFRKEKNRR